MKNVMSASNEIRLNNVSKSYGDKAILSDFSLSLTSSLTCIMAPSGKGKTTIANIITGLIPVDSGEVIVPAGIKFAYVFQEDRLLEGESAISNLLFVCDDPKAKRQRANDLLTAAALGDSMIKKAAELSGGMRRRVAICRALISEYDILILDEPFKGLDTDIKVRLMDLVKKETSGKTVVLITHDHSEATYLGCEVIEIHL